MFVDSIFHKYDNNLYDDLIQLSQKANVLGNVLKGVESAFHSLEDSIETIINKLPSNNSSTSLISLLSLTMNTQIGLQTNISMLSDIYKKLGVALKQPWNWNEKLSDFEKIQKQQKHQIYNIKMYRSFVLYCKDMVSYFETSPTTPSLDTKKLRPFVNVSERLISERESCVAVDYTKSLEEIGRIENRQPHLLPLGFERIMYSLYYTTDDIEGVFRQCGGMVEMTEYLNFIRVVDFKLADPVLLAALLKKYIRETELPIWPLNCYEQLMQISATYVNNPTQWKMKFRTLYAAVPERNRSFLEYFIALCLKITENKTSKMNINNLSTCIAPGLIRKLVCNNTNVLQDTQSGFIAFGFMLTYAKELFSGIDMKFIDGRKDEIINPPSLYKDVFEEKKNLRVTRTPLSSRTPIVSRPANRPFLNGQHKRTSMSIDKMTIKSLC
ncbi:Rho-GAP domain-containing protein [Entamoeba marina]